MPSESTELRVHLSRVGVEPALLGELGRVFPRGSHRVRSAGMVESTLTGDDCDRVVCVGFARQCLPSCAVIEAPSISTWARAAAEHVITALKSHEGPWRLHMIAQEYKG